MTDSDGLLFDPLIGVLLHHWHMSQGDPVYEVGSLIHAGVPVSREHVQACVGNLELCYSEAKDASDRVELNDLIETLTEEQTIEC